MVTSAGADYTVVSDHLDDSGIVLTAVKLALAWMLDEGAPEIEELSVPFAMPVG